MTDLVDAFSTLEHVEFAARLQGAQDVAMFLDFARGHAGAQMLMQHRDAEAVVERMHKLLTKRIDPNYMHPDDPALAVYLDVLYRLEQPAALRRAWKLCAANPKLYWTHQVAQTINLREQSATAAKAAPPRAGLDPEEDTDDLAPEPTPPGVPTGADGAETTVAALKEAGDMIVDAPPAPFPAPPAAITPEDFARVFYQRYMEATRFIAAERKQQARPMPAWDDINPSHPVRAIFQATCDDMLARLHAVPYVPFPPENVGHRNAVAHAIQQGKIAARVTLYTESENVVE